MKQPVTALWAQLSDGGTIIDRNIREDAQRVAGYAGFEIAAGPMDGLWLIVGPNVFDVSWFGGPEDAAMIVARDPRYMPDPRVFFEMLAADCERETVHMSPDQ